LNSNSNLFIRQYFSEVIDLALCLITSLMVFIFSDLKNLQINVYHLIPIVYLVYGLFSFFIGKGRSIGDISQRIVLIRTNSGKNAKFLFLIRMFVKTIIIFFLLNFKNIGFIYILISLMIIIPIKIRTKDYVYYSMLSFGSKTTYTDIKN